VARLSDVLINKYLLKKEIPYIKYSGQATARRKRFDHDIMHFLNEITSLVARGAIGGLTHIVHNMAIVVKINWVND